MRHGFRMGIALPVFILVSAAGCATREWVLEQMSRQQAAIGTQQAEMGQRIEQIGSETQRVSKQVDSVDGRVSQAAQKADSAGARVGALEPQVKSASEAARDAREHAGAAMTKAEGVDGRVAKLWSSQQNARQNRHNATVVDTLHVQFGFDRSDLDDAAQTALLGLVKELRANANLTVELVGYTDTKGGREYNYSLSQRRVDAVRRFLVERGVQTSRIQAVGLGPLADRGMTEGQKRRVSARLLIEQD
jgi:outer membrane protein OmpA-like peptidoglycan-associated protein